MLTGTGETGSPGPGGGWAQGRGEEAPACDALIFVNSGVFSRMSCADAHPRGPEGGGLGPEWGSLLTGASCLPRGREHHPARLPCSCPRLPAGLPQRAAGPCDAGPRPPAGPPRRGAVNWSGGRAWPLPSAPRLGLDSQSPHAGHHTGSLFQEGGRALLPHSQPLVPRDRPGCGCQGGGRPVCLARGGGTLTHVVSLSSSPKEKLVFSQKELKPSSVILRF